ncbi:MAG: DALR anticodon-binding domain-containing protein, partial [Candidatus Saccharibacteria bacterium]|nr:DALR anticodon-binding domain-containing protein [Candidatus Saccharibacteria bacterium]
AAARELAPSARGDGPDGRDPGADVCSSYERELMKKLLEYKSVLSEAVKEMAPHKLANYLYELAQAFSRFYEHCPVIGCDHESERLKLVQVYLDTMTHGLNLLGINIPEEM